MAGAGSGASVFWALSGLSGAILPPLVQWEKSYSGDSMDRLPCLLRTADGGFLLGGHSWSGVSGNKSTPNYGEEDFWVLRLDAQGNKVWEGNFGGSGHDFLWAMHQTPDGGFVLVGQSYSVQDGNKSSPRMGNSGAPDFWVVRLDRNGNKLWDKTYGGTWTDMARSVLETSDGGLLVGGSSQSPNDGNKTSALIGYADFWIVRLDAQGNKLWDRSYGGVADDYMTDMRPTADGGFLLAGSSGSPAGDFKGSTNYGGSDLWLVQIDADGNKLWDRAYGGTSDELNARLSACSDGGWVLGSNTDSGAGGNKTSPLYSFTNHFYDYWVLRLDADGNKVWENGFGGSLMDYFSDVRSTADGGAIVAGFSSSGVTGNKTTPPPVHRYADVWLVRVDHTGSKVWDQTYASTQDGAHPRLELTPDGGMMMAMQRGDGAEPQTMDFLLVKLSADALVAPELRFASIMSPGNAFRFQLAGISNRVYVTEYSSDLRTWSSMGTNRLMERPRRFYRDGGEIVDGVRVGRSASMSMRAGSARRFYRARMVE